MKQKAYLQSLLTKPSTHVGEMEEYAAEHGIPIMEPLGIDFLMQTIRMIKPANILEIGTAIGYSALRMVEASPQSNVVTLERDPLRYDKACKNVKAQHKEEQVKLLFGDALDLKDRVAGDGPYDVLFIDAAKGKYEEFFHLYAPLLTDRGVIISDNVLFKGYVADDEEATERMGKIARKIRSFNEWLVNHPDYHTTIVPIGDGVALTVKK